jgi:tetratricopeptide (TPR) repeat protein
VPFLGILLMLAMGGTVVAQEPDAELKALIEAARQAEQREDLGAAVEAYKKILKLRPNWASAEFNLALVYHSRRNYREAISLLELALSHNPSLSDAYLFLGSSYVHTRRYDKALPPLEHFVRLQPGNHEVLPLLAETHFRLGNYGHAAGAYLRLIRTAPAEPGPYYYLREAYLALAGACLRELTAPSNEAYFSELFAAEEGTAAEAAEIKVRELIQRYPQLPEAYIALGAIKLQQGSEAEAKTAFDEALKRDPEAGEFLIAARSGRARAGKPCPATGGLLLRAACHVSRDDINEATRAVLAIHERPARTARETYWALQFFSLLAEQTVARLAAQAPQSSVLAIIRASIFEQARDIAQAEAEYLKAVGLRQDIEALIEYGKFKCRASEFEAAISLFEKALSQDPQRADVHGLLGEVYMIQGDAAKALPHVQTAVAGNPDSVQARIYLAQALHRGGRIPEAIKVLEAASSDPDGRIHYLLGRYLTQQGRKDEANRALAIFREKRKSGEKPSPLGSLTGASVPEQ